MTAVLVTKSNLFSQSRTNVSELIDIRTNVNDPAVGSSAEFRKFVYSRRPDIKDGTFKGYPFIVVHPSEAEIATEGQSLNRKSRFVSWNVEVEIFASDRGANDHNGRGLAHLDDISDDVAETLLGVTNRVTLSANGLFFFEVNGGSVGTEIIKDELIFVRSLIINFKTRMQVSA